MIAAALFFARLYAVRHKRTASNLYGTLSSGSVLCSAAAASAFCAALYTRGIRACAVHICLYRVPMSAVPPTSKYIADSHYPDSPCWSAHSTPKGVLRNALTAFRVCKIRDFCTRLRVGGVVFVVALCGRSPRLINAVALSGRSPHPINAVAILRTKSANFHMRRIWESPLLFIFRRFILGVV